MKKILVLLLLIPALIQSQVSIDNSDFLEKLKILKIYFIAPYDVEYTNEEIKQFKSAWALSELVVIPRKNAFSKIEEKEAFVFELTSRTYTTGNAKYNDNYKQHGSVLAEQSHRKLCFKLSYIYDLKIESEDKVSWKSVEFAYIDAYEDLLKEESPSIFNKTPGMIKNYLQYLNSCLSNKLAINCQKNIAVSAKLATLKNDTLYIPKYVLKGLAFEYIKNGRSVEVKATRVKRKASEIFKDYTFPYKVISDAQLSDKILTCEKSFYYLMYICSNTDRYVSIVNAKTGKIVYLNYTRLRSTKNDMLFLNPKDIKKLIKKISPK